MYHKVFCGTQKVKSAIGGISVATTVEAFADGGNVSVRAWQEGRGGIPGQEEDRMGEWPADATSYCGI